MRISEREMNLYYGDNSHACVTKTYAYTVPRDVDLLNPKVFCGQIVPPDELHSQMLKLGVATYACVRTEDLSIVCGSAQKLYTPNYFSDVPMLPIVAIALLAAFFGYKKWISRNAD